VEDEVPVTIDALRTPDDRFAGLPGWPYAPHYVDDLPGYEGLRVHYADEGPAEGSAHLSLPARPADLVLPLPQDDPGLPGVGRPRDRAGLAGLRPLGQAGWRTMSYTFHFHRDMMVALVRAAGPAEQVTLVCQDWGGLLGLTLPPDMPEQV
jgi:haloalkane dehalogenase